MTLSSRHLSCHDNGSTMSETTDELGVYLVPDLSIKQLLDAIPYVNRSLELIVS